MKIGIVEPGITAIAAVIKRGLLRAAAVTKRAGGAAQLSAEQDA